MGFLFSKFQNWAREDYERAKILEIEPMSAVQEADEEKLDFYYNNDQWVAEEKFDGERATLHFIEGSIRAFSRYISKKSDWYTENTDSFVHFRDFMLHNFEEFPKRFDGTILDGEFKMLDAKEFAESSSILSCNWDEAQRRQKRMGKNMSYYAFDILFLKGEDLRSKSFCERKKILQEFLEILNCPEMIFVKYVSKNKQEYYEEIVANGGEGIMLKNLNMPYEHKRSKWMVKVKKYGFWDCVVIGFEPPTKEYTGKNLKEWEYFEKGKPVTKFWFNKWIGRMIFGVYKDKTLVEVGRCAGFSDSLREKMSLNPEKYIGKTVVVKANGIISNKTGSLRHPRYARFRKDKPAESCTFRDHLLNSGK